MPAIYFDSSALVKLVLDEPGSDLVAELWNRCDLAVTSRLAAPEVHAALATARRQGRLQPRSHEQAVAEWERFWAEIRPIELLPSVAQDADDLAARHELSGADSVHLASALQFGDHVLMAVWDQRLRAAAVAAGIPVVPTPAR
jgi:predicted nucleic acid-binding protein